LLTEAVGVGIPQIASQLGNNSVYLFWLLVPFPYHAYSGEGMMTIFCVIMLSQHYQVGTWFMFSLP